MTPIHELLARIRWDPEFGAAQFLISYYDRVTGAQVKVPLERIRFEPGEGFAFVAVVRRQPAVPNGDHLELLLAERKGARLLFAAVTRVTLDPDLHHQPLTQR